MTPYVADSDFTLYLGDVRECLRELPAESVHTCVTSPPYWGLRDYGTGAWDGGDSGCDHRTRPNWTPDKMESSTLHGRATNQKHEREGYKNLCGRCGATRVDQQLGLEATPDLFVAAMVDVFREVRRVLRGDGTLWLNLGDSYASSPKGNPDALSDGLTNGGRHQAATSAHRTRSTIVDGLKQKDLVGIPWRVAFALQADGWYLRSDIIWAKPNPMPESVTDRPTKAHEYVFLLSKSPRYFFDQEAVREPHTPDGRTVTDVYQGRHSIQHRAGERWPNSGRNVRSVWEIATQPYPDAHFATFPEALPERCIKAGTSERGCCPECGAPWERVTGRDEQPQAYEDRKYDRSDPKFATKRNMGGRYQAQLDANPMQTLGWRPTCDHGGSDVQGVRGVEERERGTAQGVEVDAGQHRPSIGDDAQVIPCTVLDPFMGSGTTALVARRLGRRSVGVELNPEYAALCARRLQQLSLDFA